MSKEQLEMAYRAGFISACNWTAPCSQDTDSPAFKAEVRSFIEKHTPIFDPPRPDIALLVSMAIRGHHGFGLLGKRDQLRVLQDMERLWEEVVGEGFYSPDKADFYMSQLAKE